MNDFIKSVPMPLALFHKSKRGSQASDWNTLGVPSEPMAEAVYWDCQARRYETRALFLEQAVSLLSFAALASLLAGLAVLAGVLLLAAGACSVPLVLAVRDAAASRDFRDWTLKGRGDTDERNAGEDHAGRQADEERETMGHARVPADVRS